MYTMKQLTFMDLMDEVDTSVKFVNDEKRAMKFDYFALKSGNFEYLKNLKEKETPKLIKLNYVPGDGNKNILKLDRFMKAIQKQAFEQTGHGNVLDLEDRKEVIKTMLLGTKYTDEDFDFEDVWRKKEVVECAKDVTGSGQFYAMKVNENDNITCIKLPFTSNTYGGNGLIILINLDNTFNKAYSGRHFEWRRSDDFYNCSVLTMNYSSFDIFDSILKYYDEITEDEAAEKAEKKKKAFSTFKMVFRNTKWAWRKNELLCSYLDKVLVDYEKYVNFIDNRKIASEDDKVYAKAFMTKKNIQKATMAAMKNNHFLKDFSYVEIDDTTDLEKFYDLSEYFLEYRKKMPNLLPKQEDGVSFRIRRLGNYRALGIYFPFYETIAIDVNGVESFVHECGHWLDYNKFKHASLSDEFIRDISIPFGQYFKEKNKELRAYAVSSYYYWCSSREVFARAFEVYIKQKHFKDMSCPFLKTDEGYKGDLAYTWLLDNIETVNAFFDGLEYKL